MTTKPFRGRADEQAEFKQLLRLKKSSLVVTYGRRRIGKSALISHLGRTQADHFLKFEGLAPREDLGLTEQLEAFSEQLAAQTSLPRLTIETWPQAFELLASTLPTKGKTVLLLDEISWMSGGQKDFPGYLKIAWDNLFSDRANLVVVLCGSISSWIEKNILNNTAFVGRVSWTFKLGPLSLADSLKFWGKKGERIATLEKLKLLSVTGGVPRYLEEIDPTQTAEQNIHRLCFSPGGLLFREFNDLFTDTFDKRQSRFRALCEALAGPARTVSEISKELGVGRGGVLTQALADLEGAGFITSDLPFSPETGRTLRTAKYRLSDNYVRFYLRYVAPHKQRIAKGLFKQQPLESLQSWDSLMGLQFENLILQNIPALTHALGLDKTPILNAAPYFQKKTAKKKSCQIDLLLRTRQSLYLVEIKLRETITKAVIEEVKEKVTRLNLSKPRSCRTILVYHGHLKPGLREEDFFDNLIPFEDLIQEA